MNEEIQYNKIFFMKNNLPAGYSEIEIIYKPILLIDVWIV